MSYEDRLLDAIISTPDDIDYPFQYTDVEIDIEKKTSSFIFGEVDGQLIQDFGLGAINIPLTIYFSGPDYDLIADAFQESASMKGVSILQHPKYGIKNVNITKAKRRDNLKTAANQAVFVLDISETIIPEELESGLQTRRAILAYMNSLEDVNAGVFETNFLAELASDLVAAKNRVLDVINTIKSNVTKLLNTVTEIQETFDQLERSLVSNIDFFMGAPLLLANNLQRLIATPARLKTSVKDRIDVYKEQYNKLFTEEDPVSDQDKKNQMAEKQLVMTSIISAMAEVYLFPEGEGIDTQEEEITDDKKGFLTQTDAINSAADLREQYLEGQDYLDSLEAASISDPLDLRFEVSDQVAQLIKKITSGTSKNLVRLSFSLKKERSVILEKPYDLITLAYKLYGSSQNDKLDLLIDANKLTGEEILEIPKGKEILFYV